MTASPPQCRRPLDLAGSPPPRSPNRLSILAALLHAAVLANASLPASGSTPAAELNHDLTKAADRAIASTVSIEVNYKLSDLPTGDRDETKFEPLPPGFWRKFDSEFSRPENIQGQGSGVVVRKDGFIVTNRHVVENAQSIRVRLNGGGWWPARLVASNLETDLALLKVDADKLKTAVFANSLKVRAGEMVIAVGAPFGLEFSCSFGHISSPLRTNVVTGPATAPRQQVLIQTDLNINPGNSGGPLVNIEGKVIGINSLVRGSQTGIGFAIPSHIVQSAVAAMLKQTGKEIDP